MQVSIMCNIGNNCEQVQDMILQWDPFITDTFGEHSFGRYTEMAFVEGLFCVQTLHLGPVYLAVISQMAFLQGWPLRGVPL